MIASGLVYKLQLSGTATLTVQSASSRLLQLVRERQQRLVGSKAGIGLLQEKQGDEPAGR